MTKGKAKTKYVKKLSLEKVLKKGPAGFNYIKQQTGLTRTDAIKQIKKLKKNGVHVENYLNAKYVPQFYINNNPTNIVNNFDLGLKEGNYVLGFESDLHMGDKAHKEDAHNKAYDEYEDAGVIAILDAGDLTTGVNVYRGQQADLSYHTLDDQIQYVVDTHPSISGVKKHVIGGNHDYDSLKSCGINPLTVIQSKRDDIKFIGWSDAKINIGGGVTFELCHYKGSMAWSLGYRAQKFLRDCDASSMPDILGLGHKHVAMYANIQGVHSLEGGTFQGQNNFTKERGLHGSVCSWIIEYTIEAGKISKFKPELLVF